MIARALFSLFVLLAACGDDATAPRPAVDAGDSAGTPDGWGTDGFIPLSPDTSDGGGAGGCKSHGDCGSLFCMHASGVCVECLLHEHCPKSQTCRAGACEAETPCGPELPCAGGVCSDGRCVDCAADADCGGGSCQLGVCHAGVLPCASETTCASYEMSCDASKGICVECLTDAHCEASEFCKDEACYPDVCAPLSVKAACVGNAITRCAVNGSGFEDVPCGTGERCEPGVEGSKSAACEPISCTPGERVCDGLGYTICNETGTDLLYVPCPSGTACLDGECRFPKPVILVVFDTSSSMWGYPMGGLPEQCAPPETACVDPWPACEKGTDGITLMGRSKKVFASLFDKFADKAHFALLRFPQKQLYTASPSCKNGYYTGLLTMEGDPDAHSAPAEPGTWFTDGLPQVLLVPVPKDDETSNIPSIQKWLDFTETAMPTGHACTTDAECDGGFCSKGETGECWAHENPELRPVGQTPLGRSLFYAGEYVRQRIVVDGRACSADADCQTPFHRCEDGTCRDALRKCRRVVVLLFTDGTESVDKDLTSWFNPRNQAKRMHFGLGCGGDDDCLSGAKCVEGTCQSEAVQLPDLVCQDTGKFCQTDADCPGSACGPDVNTYLDPEGVQRLVDAEGNPIVTTVSVVTVGLVSGAAKPIAAYGGGDYFHVENADPAELLGALTEVVNAKLSGECQP